MHCEPLPSPLTAPKVPVAHMVGAEEPAAQKSPWGHVTHPSTVLRPSVAEYVPAEHCVQTEADVAEKVPASHWPHTEAAVDE